MTRGDFVRRSFGVALAVYLGSAFKPPTAGRIADAEEESAFALPIGTVIRWGGDAPPSGWLICDGTSVPISSYRSLFAVIGNTYGGSRWQRTFRLPDTRSAPESKTAVLAEHYLSSFPYMVRAV